MLYPLVRSARCTSACLLFPGHQFQAIAVTEVPSVIIPLFDIEFARKAIAVTIAIMYAPSFTSALLKILSDVRRTYYEAEICFLLLLTAYLII